jgi:hypothetical protein
MRRELKVRGPTSTCLSIEESHEERIESPLRAQLNLMRRELKV